MKDDQVTQALLSEYSEMRAEIRTMITVSNTSIRTGIALIAGVVSLSSFLQDPRIIYLIPTTMFLGTMIIVSQGSSVSTLGTYCMLLSQKIKDHLGHDNVVFEWESGPIWQIGGHPSGPVARGLYLAWIIPFVAFLGISWAAFRWWPPSLFIHAPELVIAIIYGGYSVRYNTLGVRKKLLDEYIKRTSNAAAAHDQTEETEAPQT